MFSPTQKHASDARISGRANRFVASVLQSRLHRVLSSWICLIEYEGAKTSRRYRTPTQYVEHDGGVTILVGQPGRKNWWRNFRSGPRAIDILIGGKWRHLEARAVIGRDEPDEARQLLDAYLQRFPSARKAINARTDDARAALAVFVRATSPV